MIVPDFLKPGDSIGLAATARKVSPQEMAPCIQLLESWGYKVVPASNLYSIERQFAGSDAERAAGLQELMDNAAVKAIVFARGGYGTVRIIDDLDFTQIKKYPRWMAGFSDITILHSQLQNLGIASMHTPMAINMVRGESYSSVKEAVHALKNLLSGNISDFDLQPHELNIAGNAEGILTGGNLSVLCSMLASASETDTAGKILFLEDLDEYLYHIDRMMHELKRSGRLSKLAGLIIGGMSDMRDNAVPFGRTAEQIIHEAVAEYGYPVCFNFPAGHQPVNMPFILGTKIRLVVNESGSSIKF